MSSVALEPASRFTHAELTEIFNAGYEGYYTPFKLDEDAFRFMSTIWDDDLDASRVALVDGAPAGICKLAIRGIGAHPPSADGARPVAARRRDRGEPRRGRGPRG
jgi:hypothetical protein